MTALPRDGAVHDGAYLYPVRVYYEDTDAVGLVYHANYLKFAERARTEMLRRLGIEQERLRAESGVSFVVRRGTLDFRAPARLDDDLVVVTTLRALGEPRARSGGEARRRKPGAAFLPNRRDRPQWPTAAPAGGASRGASFP